ncbi:MAG: hypothetical protein DHS80DRAFT_22368 [Piptocephalis tieghemiana]|nr:MAG: hypothetical protein DHS80DRAFT_22368 [Piptocephalis tieghemiana]
MKVLHFTLFSTMLSLSLLASLSESRPMGLLDKVLTGKLLVKTKKATLTTGKQQQPNPPPKRDMNPNPQYDCAPDPACWRCLTGPRHEKTGCCSDKKEIQCFKMLKLTQREKEKLPHFTMQQLSSSSNRRRANTFDSAGQHLQSKLGGPSVYSPPTLFRPVSMVPKPDPPPHGIPSQISTAFESNDHSNKKSSKSKLFPSSPRSSMASFGSIPSRHNNIPSGNYKGSQSSRRSSLPSMASLNSSKKGSSVSSKRDKGRNQAQSSMINPLFGGMFSSVSSEGSSAVSSSSKRSYSEPYGVNYRYYSGTNAHLLQPQHVIDQLPAGGWPTPQVATIIDLSNSKKSSLKRPSSGASLYSNSAQQHLRRSQSASRLSLGNQRSTQSYSGSFASDKATIGSTSSKLSRDSSVYYSAMMSPSSATSKRSTPSELKRSSTLQRSRSITTLGASGYKPSAVGLS